MTDHQLPSLPARLVEQFRDEAPRFIAREMWVHKRIAQWGFDQAVEACVEHVRFLEGDSIAEELRAAMATKPPSLAEQTTQHLDKAVMRGDCITSTDAMPYLRQALQRLAELEQQATL